MLRFILFILILVIPGAASASNTFVFPEDNSRTVELIGVVRGDAIQLADKINALSEESDDDIYMLINSPGGSVGPGMAVVDSMLQAKARGVEFHCFSGVLAASMAFIILSHCDNRVTFHNTKLLFHPISLSTRGSRIQELFVSLEQILAQERRIMRHLQSVMGLPWRDFHMHYFAETFWAATELKEHTKRERFLKTVTKVRNASQNLFRWRSKRRGLFGKDSTSSGSVQEIVKRFLEGRQ